MVSGGRAATLCPHPTAQPSQAVAPSQKPPGEAQWAQAQGGGCLGVPAGRGVVILRADFSLSFLGLHGHDQGPQKFSPHPEAGSWKSSCGQGCTSSGGPEGGPFLLFQLPGPQVPLGCGRSPPVSVSLVT